MQFERLNKSRLSKKKLGFIVLATTGAVVSTYYYTEPIQQDEPGNKQVELWKFNSATMGTSGVTVDNAGDVAGAGISAITDVAGLINDPSVASAGSALASIGGIAMAVGGPVGIAAGAVLSIAGGLMTIFGADQGPSMEE